MGEKKGGAVALVNVTLRFSFSRETQRMREFSTKCVCAVQGGQSALAPKDRESGGTSGEQMGVNHT